MNEEIPSKFGRLDVSTVYANLTAWPPTQSVASNLTAKNSASSAVSGSETVKCSTDASFALLGVDLRSIIQK